MKDDAVQFFYDHAGYSWTTKTETEEEGRLRCAKLLANAEELAWKRNYTFAWMQDSDADSSDFSDEDPPWELWVCLMRDSTGCCVASMGAVDFGRDGSPWDDPHRRVVEAELALEALM